MVQSLLVREERMKKQNTEEHSTWNFGNGSEKIRMGKGMDKDKVEGKKERKKYK